MASLSLRGLVENPYELEGRTNRGSRPEAHPLGPGIPVGRKWLPHGEGHVRLPSGGPALEHLLATRAACLHSEMAEFADSAWAGLIALPSAVVPLCPEDEALRFGLVSVFKRPEEDLTRAGLSYPRLAATSRLRIKLATQTGFIEEARLSSEWHLSSSSLLADLGVMHEEALPGAILNQVHRRISILLHPQVSQRLTVDDRRRLTTSATLLNSDLDLMDRANLDRRSAERRLAGSAGGGLVIVGPMDPASASLRELYMAIDPGRIVRHVAGSGPRDLFEAVLEQMMELAGVNSSLLPIVPPEKSPKSRERRPSIPIQKPRRCLHHGSRVYVEDETTGLWWTRDDDRHAGTIFKTYSASSSQLEHQADRDEEGNIIDKHKGPQGLRIPMSELRGCRKPAYKHLA